MDHKRQLIQQLFQQISGSPHFSDWNKTLLNDYTPTNLIANLLQISAENISQYRQDPKTILIMELLKKLGVGPEEPLIPGTVFTPVKLLSALIDIPVQLYQEPGSITPEELEEQEEVGRIQIAERDEDKHKIIWSKPLLPRVHTFEDVESYLHKIISAFIHKNPDATYDDISTMLWDNYSQEVSDFGRACTGPHRPYFVQYLIKEIIFSDVCAIGSASIEQAARANNLGIKYIDIIKQIKELPEYKVLVRIWPPFGEIRILRAALKKCFIDAGYKTSGKTSSLRWHCEEQIATISNECGHPSVCAVCKIKLRCRNCSNSSPNSSGQTCMRCSTVRSSVVAETVLVAISDKPTNVDLAGVTADELKDIEDQLEEEGQHDSFEEDLKYLETHWKGILESIEICNYPPTGNECSYIPAENTKYRSFKEYVWLYYPDTLETEITSLPDNPYYLIPSDHEWYDHIYQYYIKTVTALDLQTLENIGKRFGTNVKHICDTMLKILKIDVGICPETPAPAVVIATPILHPDGRRYKILVCIDPKNRSIPEWLSEVFDVTEVSAITHQRLSAEQPDAALVWHVPSRDIGSSWKRICEEAGVPVLFRNKGIADTIRSAERLELAWFVEAAIRYGGLSRRNPESERNPENTLNLTLRKGVWIYGQNEKTAMKIRAIPLKGSLGDDAGKYAVAHPCIFIYNNISSTVAPDHILFSRGVTGDKVFYISRYLISDCMMANYLANQLKGLLNKDPDIVLIKDSPKFTITHNSQLYNMVVERFGKPWILQEFAQLENTLSMLNFGIHQHGHHAKFATALLPFAKIEPLGNTLLHSGYATRAEFLIQVKTVSEAKKILKMVDADPYLRQILLADPESIPTKSIRIMCLVAMMSYLHVQYLQYILTTLSSKPVSSSIHYTKKGKIMLILSRRRALLRESRKTARTQLKKKHSRTPTSRAPVKKKTKKKKKP